MKRVSGFARTSAEPGIRLGRGLAGAWGHCERSGAGPHIRIAWGHRNTKIKGIFSHRRSFGACSTALAWLGRKLFIDPGQFLGQGGNIADDGVADLVVHLVDIFTGVSVHCDTEGMDTPSPCLS